LFSEIHAKHTKALCGEKEEWMNVKSNRNEGKMRKNT
jgi:hypothetical protein